MSEHGEMTPGQALRSAQDTAEFWRKTCGERDKEIAALRTTVEEQAKRIIDFEHSMKSHFQRDHLEGDGPEIDRWKRKLNDQARAIGRLRAGLESVIAFSKQDTVGNPALIPAAMAAVAKHALSPTPTEA